MVKLFMHFCGDFKVGLSSQDPLHWMPTIGLMYTMRFSLNTQDGALHPETLARCYDEEMVLRLT